MYLSMDSDYFGSCLYFIVAVVILNFWFINLLTAVVVNTFKVIRAETKQSAFGATEYVDSLGTCLARLIAQQHDERDRASVGHGNDEEEVRWQDFSRLRED